MGVKIAKIGQNSSNSVRVILNAILGYSLRYVTSKLKEKNEELPRFHRKRCIIDRKNQNFGNFSPQSFFDLLGLFTFQKSASQHL